MKVSPPSPTNNARKTVAKRVRKTAAERDKKTVAKIVMIGRAHRVASTTAKSVKTDRVLHGRKIATVRVSKAAADHVLTPHARTPHTKRALTRHAATSRAMRKPQDLTTSKNLARAPSHTARAAPAPGKNRKAHHKVCPALPGHRTRALICPDANPGTQRLARRTRHKQRRTLAKKARTHTRGRIHRTARSAGTQAPTSQQTRASPVNHAHTNQAASHTRAVAQMRVPAKPVPAHHAAPSRLIACSDMKNGLRDPTSRGPICVLRDN